MKTYASNLYTNKSLIIDKNLSVVVSKEGIYKLTYTCFNFFQSKFCTDTKSLHR